MNRKLTEQFISIISILGTLAGLAQIILSLLSPKIPQNMNLTILAIIGFLLLLLSVYVLRSKKQFIDLYDIVSFIALNNRPQTLQEIIFIQYRKLMKKTHKNKMDLVVLHYSLKEGENDHNSYDLHCKLSYDISRPRFCKNSIKNRTLRFYIITLATLPANFRTKITKMTDRDREISYSGHQTEDMQVIPECTVECVKKNCTTSGESGSNEIEYSGLYEITTVLPPSFSKVSRLNITYDYAVIGQIKKTQKKHSFTIIPSNYGNKISSLDVRVSTEYVPISDVEFQCYKRDTGFSIAELFIQDDSLSEKTAAHQEFSLTTKPNMNAVYSVQFTLPNECEER